MTTVYRIDSLDLSYLSSLALSDRAPEEEQILQRAKSNGDFFLTEEDYGLPAYPVTLSQDLLKTDHAWLVKAMLRRNLPYLASLLSDEWIELIADNTSHVPLQEISSLCDDIKQILATSVFQNTAPKNQTIFLRTACVLFDAKFVAEAFYADYFFELSPDFSDDVGLVYEALKEGRLSFEIDERLASTGEFVLNEASAESTATSGIIKIKTKDLPANILLHECLHAADRFLGRKLSPVESEKRHFVDAIYAIYTGDIEAAKAAYQNEAVLSSERETAFSQAMPNLKSKYSISGMNRILYGTAYLFNQFLQKIGNEKYIDVAFDYAEMYLAGSSLDSLQGKEKEFENVFVTQRAYTFFRDIFWNNQKILFEIYVKSEKSDETALKFCEEKIKQLSSLPMMASVKISLATWKLFKYLIESQASDDAENYIDTSYWPAIEDVMRQPPL